MSAAPTARAGRTVSNPDTTLKVVGTVHHFAILGADGRRDPTGAGLPTRDGRRRE